MSSLPENRIVIYARWALRISLHAAFLSLVFSLGFMWPSFLFHGFSIPITDLIFPFVFLLWLAALLIGSERVEWNGFYTVLLLFLGACSLSVFFSQDFERSLLKLAGETYLVGLAVLTFNLTKDKGSARRLIQMWIAATAVSSAVSVLSFFLFYFDRTNMLLSYSLYHYGTLPAGNYPRISGTFLNANLLCNYLNVSVMFLLAGFHLGWINRKLFYSIIPILGLAIAFTISPGIGGVLLSIGIWFWARNIKECKYRLANVWLFCGCAAALAFFIAILIAPAPNALAEFQITPLGIHLYSSERVSAWIAATRTFLAHPIFGVGLGLDSGTASSIFPDGSVHTVTDAHQIWLNFAAQTGIVGSLSLIGLMIYLIRKMWPVRFELSDTSVLRVAGGCAFIGAFLYQGLGGSYEDARHLWVLMGFIVSPSVQGNKQEAAIAE